MNLKQTIGRTWSAQRDGTIQYPRSLVSALRVALLDTPVVCLHGPRRCGKTTLAMSLENDRGYIPLNEGSSFRVATENSDGFEARLPTRVSEIKTLDVTIPAITPPAG